MYLTLYFIGLKFDDMDSDDNYYLNSKINFPSSNCIHDFTKRVDMERALLFLSFIDLIYE
jgi:hypothetical protein